MAWRYKSKITFHGFLKIYGLFKMKSSASEESQRILLLLKLDAQRLYERIRDRRSEYVKTFALKRTREHFIDVFKNRYYDVSISDLKCCGQEVILAMDNFYTKIDNFFWYLQHTEDMPVAVEDRAAQEVRTLKPLYQTLSLFIDAELGYQEELAKEAISS